MNKNFEQMLRLVPSNASCRRSVTEGGYFLSGYDS